MTPLFAMLPRDVPAQVYDNAAFTLRLSSDSLDVIVTAIAFAYIITAVTVAAVLRKL